MDKKVEEGLRMGQKVLQMLETNVMEVSQKGPMGILCIVAAAYCKGKMDAFKESAEIVAEDLKVLYY